MTEFAQIADDTKAPRDARRGAAIALGVLAGMAGHAECPIRDTALHTWWQRGWAIGANQHRGRVTYAARVAEAMESAESVGDGA